jgi:DNA-3-methyladenine glycosylase I
MAAYHDDEWGVPVFEDRLLFEHLSLDLFQAGLSWRTVLLKRDAFRHAFQGFDPQRIARFTDRDVRRLLTDAGIIRNRRKIEATICNARAYLDLQETQTSFGHYLWDFVGGETLRRKPARTWDEIPTSSPESEAMAKDLKAKGFRFVGGTICYAFMQAVGMVDDHLVGCFRYQPGRRAGTRGRE